MESKKEVKSTGLICIKDEVNIEYVVSKIDYIVYEDESFKYIFTPYYDVIEYLESTSRIFQGLPGINLDLKKEEYIRENRVPVFISERVPSKNREDFYALLEEVNMKYMDPILYLIRTKLQYFGDTFYVKPFKEREEVHLEDIASKCNLFGLIKKILDNLSHGNKVFLNNTCLENNKDLFITFKYLYSKSYSSLKENLDIYVAENKALKKYKGRKPKTIDKLVFLDRLEKLKNNQITLNDILNKFQISRSTFFRLKNKYMN